MVDQYLAVVAALGIDLDAVGPPVFPIVAGTPPPRRWMARWLEEEGVKPTTPLVLLNPGSGGDHKRWAVEAFRRLGEELAVRLGARVAITWGRGGAARARNRSRHANRALVPPPDQHHGDDRALPAGVARRRRRHRPRARGGGARRPDGRALRPDERAAERALRSPGGGDPEPDRPDGRPCPSRPCSARRRRSSAEAGDGVASLSVAIVVLNEEERLRACLESVVWADEIVVVDAGSSDKTMAIAREFTDRAIFRAWDGYGAQKNFALGQCHGDWVLSIDADERVSDALREEIQATLRG